MKHGVGWALADDLVSVITTSGGHCERTGQREGPADGVAVGEQFAAAVKYDDAVAQPSRALLGVSGDNQGRQVIGRPRSRTLTHVLPPLLSGSSDTSD
jgi:hypothetical protein